MAETNAQAPDQLLDLLFEDGQVGRCLVAPDGSVVRANREWLRAAGLRSDQAIGADILQLLPEGEGRTAVKRALAGAGQEVEVPPRPQRRAREDRREVGVSPVAMEGGTGLLLTSRAMAPPGTAELLEASFASMGLGVAVYGPGGELLRMNAAAERILGVSMAQLSAVGGLEGRAGLVRLQTAGAAPMPLEQTPIWRALRGQASREVEMRVQPPQGEPRWISASGAPLRGPDGVSLGIVTIFTDVTARKEAEQALVESEQKLRVSLAHAAIGFARTTPDGHFLDVNPAYCAITGYAPEELRSMAFPALVHPDDRAANMRQIERMLGGEISDFVTENRYLRKGGDAVWVRKSVSIVRSAAGEPQWFIALIEDVTERKRAERALRESEQRFRLALRNAPVSVAAQDRDLRFIWAYNQRTVRPDQVVGRLDADLFTAEEAARLSAIKRRVLEQEVEHREQLWLERPGGRVFLDVFFEPLRDDVGRVVGVGTATVDLTPMKLAEEALRESEGRLRLLAEALPQLVWTGDERGEALSFNQRWRDYTGQAPGAEAWEPALHPEDRERVMALWRDAVERQRGLEVEHRLRRFDGEYRWFLRRAILLRQADGQGGCWFGTCTDIHDLRTSQDLLRQADRLKEDFLSMASHEFRTPLTALRLQLELLQRRLRRAGPPDERLERQLAVVEAQLDRMEGLLGMLLDVSRINAGRLALQLEEMDLGALALEVVERFRLEPSAAGTELRVRARGARGRWDRMRLDQVLTNLVSNAVKYGSRLPVEVEVEERGDAAVLVVRDHGIGIQPESLARIFERFERGANVGAVQGLGIGLWIVRRLVEAHGGEIAVASAPGVGSTFTVSLPRSPPAQACPA